MNTTEPFGARLMRAIGARGPLCVGIDPHPGLLADWDLPATPRGLERFSLAAVEALGPVAAVLKPQSAFFERYGSAGIAVLERVLRESRDTGAMTIVDVKRGDIGSTMTAYAGAYLADDSPLAGDALTVSPYLGFGALTPAIDLARAHGRGVFVLALTSNPEGAAVQHARGGDGRTVAQAIVDQVAEVNAGAEPLGSVGLVVGATIGRPSAGLSAVNGPLLAPGLGAQGASPADLASVFAGAGGVVLPSVSRGVLAAGPSATGLRAAAAALVEELRRSLE